MSDLKKAIVRLAHQKPELRAHLLPLLKTTMNHGTMHGFDNRQDYEAFRYEMSQKVDSRKYKDVIDDEGVKKQLKI